MTWITNVSKEVVRQGNHPDADILIQIQDPLTDFVAPNKHFKEIHQLEFLDCEDNERIVDRAFWPSQKDASQLVAILVYALEQDYNVVVHCHAGICRSGAVVEVGTMMGFHNLKAHRIPNVLLKTLMIKELGWGY